MAGRSQLRTRLEWVLALILALGVGIAVFSYNKNLEVKYQSESNRTKAYFVIRDIPSGTPLTDVLNLGYVEQREVLSNTLSQNAVTLNFQPGESLYAKQDVTSGQLLLISDFQSTQVTTSGLSIPDGFVAISTRLADTDRVGPFLRPGNEVAIFVTGVSRKEPISTTRILIPKARVIGLGDTKFVNGQAAIVSGDLSIVTLALEPRDAALVIQASKTMSIQLALLGKGTSDVKERVTVQDLLG